MLLAACTQPVPNSTDGQVLFEYTCARCHAKDGHGDPMLKSQIGVPDMTSPDWQRARTDDDIKATIRNGSKSGKMPPFGKSYTDEQLDALVKYVRHFRGQ